MATLLALDPGGSTGWSLWHYGAAMPLTHQNHGTIAGGLQGFLRWWDLTVAPLDAIAVHQEFEVVAEDFVLDGRTLKPDTTPLEILGALEMAVYDTGVPLARQRNFMKAHAPDELLKAKGLWWPGAGHDRDSARHAIAFLKTRRHAPTLRWLYGK